MRGDGTPSRPMTEAIPFEKERTEMIDWQLRRRGIRDERVLEAMFQVPRHEFVPRVSVYAAYEDRPLPIGDAETISQPYIVAAMTQALRVRPGEKVLEVGTGSGYQAAILAYLGASVYSIERNGRLADEACERLARLGFTGVEVICGDGSEGYPQAAPYQGIVVTAAAPRVPQTLLDQLADEGRMIIPVGNLHHQDLLLLTKHADQITTRALDPCQFVPLIGKAGWPAKPSWV
jgi:protein-L-isoaspartate(D-aspartate) O-methyltransferase